MTITENQLENLCLDWFRAGGYSTAYGPDIAFDGATSERRDYQQTILTGRLITALQKINPHIPLATLEEAALTITKPESPVLIHNNRAFHKLLLEGVTVEYRAPSPLSPLPGGEGDLVCDHVQLIDFHNVEKNQFLVVNQFTIQGTKRLRRPDLIVFINGLPIAVIELKNPADANVDVWSAYNQLQTYKDEIADLFVCNAALVVSDGLTARVGSLTANKERFLPWRTIRNEDDKPLLEYELEKV
ncbi:MAG: type I restriction endonuclease, partial [Trichloromonadaceae bacterium]